MEKKLPEFSKRKNCRKQIKKQFRIEKVIKKRGGKLYVKDIITCLIVGQIKET